MLLSGFWENPWVFGGGFFGLMVVFITHSLIKTWITKYKVSPLGNYSSRNNKKNVRTLIVLGSGGHSAEMFKLVSALNKKIYTPRIYVVAETDELSLIQLRARDRHGIVKLIPRSRSVKQSYVTSVISTLKALVKSVPIYRESQPDLILCNGPGTCVPICLLTWFLYKVGLTNKRTKILFVESVCRVQTLSLSGKILSYVADEVLVQWPELAERYPSTKYVARFT